MACAPLVIAGDEWPVDVARHHTFSFVASITDSEIGKQAKLNYCMAFCRLLSLPFEYITSHTSCTVQSRLLSLETREPKTQPRRCPRKRRVTNYPYYQRVNVPPHPVPQNSASRRARDDRRNARPARLDPREFVSLPSNSGSRARRSSPRRVEPLRCRGTLNRLLPPPSRSRGPPRGPEGRCPKSES